MSKSGEEMGEYLKCADVKLRVGASCIIHRAADTG